MLSNLVTLPYTILGYLNYWYTRTYEWFVPPLQVTTSSIYIDHNIPNTTKITTKFDRPELLIQTSGDVNSTKIRDFTREHYENKQGMLVHFDNTMYPAARSPADNKHIISTLRTSFSTDPYIEMVFDVLLEDDINITLKAKGSIYLIIYELQNSSLLVTLHLLLEQGDGDSQKLEYYIAKIAVNSTQNI